jgi:hypothetical protein
MIRTGENDKKCFGCFGGDFKLMFEICWYILNLSILTFAESGYILLF